MRKPTIDFDWQELPPDQQFPFIPASARQGPASSRGHIWQRSAIIVSALSLLLLALYSAIWVRQEAEAGLAKIQNELTVAADEEIGRARARLATPALPNVDSTAWDQEAVVHVEMQALRQDLAAVMVVTEAKRSADAVVTTHRQLRFYRQTAGGWQPTEPVPSLWGQPQRLATRHFDFTYRSRDAPSVQAVAADIDALYVQMRDNLGLPRPPESKITIAVEVGPVTGNQAVSKMDATHVLVSSPALLPAPDFLTDAVILRQSILLDLAEKINAEAADVHSIPPHWHALLTTMRIWQIWELGGPAAAWRKPVLRWFYRRQLNETVLPPEYAELCVYYSMWERGQNQLTPPHLCTELDHFIRQNRTDWETLHFADFIRIPPYRFTLTPKNSVHDDSIYMQPQFEWILWVTLLDYGATTYSRNHISALWSILYEHNDWGTLIPAVFGVPAEEFEADWQTYIADKIAD